MYINDRGQKVFVGQEALDLHPRVVFRRLLERIHYRTTFQKLPISIENRVGSVRSGTDYKTGEEWRTKMKKPYGYIRGTEGVDGDHLDVFVGGFEDAPYAYVIHSMKDEGKTFDEDKVMLGFKTAEAAKNCFLQHYDDPSFYGGIEKIPMWKFHDIAFVKKITTKKIKESATSPEPSVQPNANALARSYDKGEVMLGAPLMMVHRFYPDVLGSLSLHKDIEKRIELDDPDTIPKELKKKQKPKRVADLAEVQHKRRGTIHEGASLQLPEEFFEKKYDQGGRDTDQIMRKSILGHHQDIMTDPEVRESIEGGPGSGRHADLEKRINNLVKSIQITKDPSGKKVLARRLENLRDEISNREAREHGVKGMKWGVRHARHDAAASKRPTATGKPGKTPLPASKRSLANDPRTLSMMQVVHNSQNKLNQVSQQQKEEKAQGKPSTTERDHEKALDALKELGWKIAEVGAKLTGTEALVGAVKSVVRSPAGQKLFLSTDKEGNHKITTDGKNPASKPHEPRTRARARASAIESFGLREGGPGSGRHKISSKKTLTPNEVRKYVKGLNPTDSDLPDQVKNVPYSKKQITLGSIRDLGEVLEMVDRNSGKKEIGGKVRQYVNQREKGSDFPAILLDYHMNIVDGFRRVAAAMKHGDDKITALIPKKNKESRTFESRMGSFLREAKVYYARSIDNYGNAAESEDINDIEEAGDDAVIPATKNHAKLGMDYFHKKIDKADKVVLQASKGRKLTLGVFSEATHALHKGKPVFARYRGKMRRVKSVEALGKPNKAGHFGRIIFRKKRKG